MFIRLVSAAGTGFFYVKRKNPRRIQTKLEFRKYDPRVNRHVLFTEQKMNSHAPSLRSLSTLSAAQSLRSLPCEIQSPEIKLIHSDLCPSSTGKRRPSYSDRVCLSQLEVKRLD
ncbi:hypothetical protein F0562_017039 [Nyssa sinensis]|uniref:Large ribosomal subunit protein bL33c n=1 Tax=Nyssa sinensis TaxID=561372 RepID=A0A5J4ZDT5_9ASTE|nr:hypothetical protein F0562_017039 [Nyssa sinensis]